MESQSIPSPAEEHLPSTEEIAQFIASARETHSFHAALRADFLQACEALTEPDGVTPCNARNAVRFFGSLIDGLAAAMRDIALQMCSLWKCELDERERAQDRQTSAYSRIIFAYRLMEGFLSESPFRRIGAKHWKDLQHALALRNRVIHPASVSDLDVKKKDLLALFHTSEDFQGHFDRFVHWATSWRIRSASGEGEASRKSRSGDEPRPGGSESHA